MEALRIIKSPEQGKITIILPEELKAEKELEVIVLPVGGKKEIKKGFDPRKFKGAVKLDMSVEEIDRECRKVRDDWERGF